jgi:hypothetical protein
LGFDHADERITADNGRLGRGTKPNIRWSDLNPTYVLD